MSAVLGRAARALVRAWRRRRLDPRRRFLPDVRDGEVTRCPPAEILRRQYDGDRCLRLDLILRLLVLEQARGSGPEGRRIYDTYRARRSATDKSLDGFLQVLADIDRNGFDPERPITVARDGAIPDGAHRLACAVHLELPEVPVRVVGAEHRFYTVGASWFRRHGFTAQDVALLEDAAARYRQRAGSAVTHLAGRGRP